MANAPILELEQPESTSIATIVARTPAVVLVDQAKREDLYAHIRREIEAFEPDLTTAKGRDAIKSLSFKITRTKTAIDAAGKQLNEEARAKINVVDAARRDARDTLDRLAAEVRQPLTKWEEAEKLREQKAAEGLQIIADLARVDIADTAETVAARIAELDGVTMNPETYRDAIDGAEKQRVEAIAGLRVHHKRLVREEADRAELARLRAEVEERERVEAARRAEEERVAREAEEARIAEERRAAAEKAEAERIERARKEAEDNARRAAERAAAAERERIQREHEEALAAEARRADEAERAARAEKDRAAREEAAREAEAKRLADEQVKREANKAHRTRVKTAAKQAIMTCGVSEEAAQKIVLAIIAGEVPRTTIAF